MPSKRERTRISQVAATTFAITSCGRLTKPSRLLDEAAGIARTAGPLELDMDFHFWTWNVDYYNRFGTELQEQIDFAGSLGADALALQEVRGSQTRHYGSGCAVFASEFFPDRNTSEWM